MQVTPVDVSELAIRQLLFTEVFLDARPLCNLPPSDPGVKESAQDLLSEAAAPSQRWR